MFLAFPFPSVFIVSLGWLRFCFCLVFYIAIHWLFSVGWFCLISFFFCKGLLSQGLYHHHHHHHDFVLFCLVFFFIQRCMVFLFSGILGGSVIYFFRIHQRVSGKSITIVLHVLYHMMWSRAFLVLLESFYPLSFFFVSVVSFTLTMSYSYELRVGASECM